MTVIKKKDVSDLRRAERFDTSQSLWFEGQERRLSAEARNMSSTGMFVVSEHPQDVGSQVRVSFVDPDAGEVSVEMEVVWTDSSAAGAPTKMGLKVIDLERRDDAFQHFIARHLSSERRDDDPVSSKPGDAADPEDE